MSTTAVTVIVDAATPEDLSEGFLAQLPRFGGRFIDLGMIARGGMGTIHRMWDQVLRREVAVKRLSSGDQVRDIQRFIIEARVTARLDHPSVVPLHDMGMLDGTPCFLMKLVEGITLAAEIAGGPAWGVSRARDRWLVEALMQVCDAVSYAHNRGVVHRDIKPDNIMLGSFSQVYLMDWGVALPLPAHRAEIMVGLPPVERETDGACAGTLGYMAPEQARGLADCIDARTDVFLLGGVLYEMLTGRAPHATSANLHAAVFKAAKCEITPCLELRADLPPQLAEVAMRALEPRSEDRFADALEMKAALRAASRLL